MAELGATDPLQLDKQKTKQPPNMAQAQEMLGEQGTLDRWKATDLGTVSPEERQRVIEYRSQPYMQQLKRLTEQQERYYEGQGLRFSTERREKSGELAADIGRQIGESVIVPQIERERGYAIQEQQLKQQAEQFAQTLGLDWERFGEVVRQFDVAGERQKNQWAEDFGLRRDELDHKIRQFNRQFTLERLRTTRQLEQEDRRINQVTDQFAQQMGLSRDQLQDAREQYRLGRIDRIREFAEQMGLSHLQLNEQIREFDDKLTVERERLDFEKEQFAQQTNQFTQQFGLDRDRFDEAVRQFGLGHDLEVSQLAQEMGLRRDELDTRIDQFNRQLAQAATEFDLTYGLNLKRFDFESAQWSADHGLRAKQFREAVRQYNLGRGDRLDEFAQTMNLSRDQLKAQIDEFQSKLALDEKVNRAVLTGIWEDEKTINWQVLFGREQDAMGVTLANRERGAQAVTPVRRRGTTTAFSGPEATNPYDRPSAPAATRPEATNPYDRPSAHDATRTAGTAIAASGPEALGAGSPQTIGGLSYTGLVSAHQSGNILGILESRGIMSGTPGFTNIRNYVASGGTDQTALRWLRDNGYVSAA